VKGANVAGYKPPFKQPWKVERSAKVRKLSVTKAFHRGATFRDFVKRAQ